MKTWIRFICAVLSIILINGCFSGCNKKTPVVSSVVSSEKEATESEDYTMQTFLKTLLQKLGYSFKTEDGFKPVEEKALQLGLIKENQKDLMQAPLKKALAAQICIRTLREPDAYPENYMEYASNINDFDKVPQEYQDAVLRSCAKGILFEDEEGNFDPDKIITKKDSIEIYDKIIYKELRRKFPLIQSKSVEVKKNYSWQSCEKETDFMPSPIWNPGNPRFSVTNKAGEKTEGNFALRIDYLASSAAWYMVGFAPDYTEPMDFSDVDYMEFDFFNNTSVERNIQFRFRDSKGLDYYCYTNYEKPFGFYGEGKIPAGKTGWVKVRVYFDHINVGASHVPAKKRDALKDVAQILMVFDDKDAQGKEQHLFIDNFKFYKVQNTVQSPKVSRFMKTVSQNHPHYAEYHQAIKQAADLEKAGKHLQAAQEYVKFIETDPFVPDISIKVSELYRKLGKEQKIKLKQQLSDSYYYWITDDFEKAKGIQAVHEKLVEIQASEKAIYSFGASVQSIGPAYSFTKQDKLVETAEVVKGLAADTIKIALGGDHFKLYAIQEERPSTLTGYVSNASYKKVLDDPEFKNYLMWTYSHKSDDGWFGKGYVNNDSLKAEYEDIYNLTKYLLETYNNTGKNFYLGNWEGDWHMTTYSRIEPTLQQLYSMTEWFAMRQQAIADARRDTKYNNVDVKFYLEVCIFSYNDLFYNASRIMNCILPYIQCEYVSLSSYQATGTMMCRLGLMEEYYENEMNYLEYMAPPADIPGRRVWVGEYGFPAVENTAESQDKYTKRVIKKSLEMGVPFVMYWNTYCNEANPSQASGYNGFWIINTKNEKQPVYFTIQNHNQEARAFTENFKKINGRMPTQRELYDAALKWIN